MPTPLAQYEPLPDWLQPSWEAFRVLRSMSGPDEGVHAADVTAHLDLLGVCDSAERRRIYRHVIALETERRRIEAAKQKDS